MLGNELLRRWDCLLEAAAEVLRTRVAAPLLAGSPPELARLCGTRARSAPRHRPPRIPQGTSEELMHERIHKIRELLLEAEHCGEWLSTELSAQRIPADLAPLVDALRHSVLTAMRVAHATELAAKLVEP